mgnify:CR=1 FL=1
MKKPIPPKDYIDAVDVPTTVELSAIGIVRSSYRERHGTPRQSTVGEARRSTIELFTDRVPEKALSGMEGIGVTCGGGRLVTGALKHRGKLGLGSKKRRAEGVGAGSL